MTSDLTPAASPRATPEQQHAAQTVEQLIRHRLSTALGGWRGSVETALPTVAFIALWISFPSWKVWRKSFAFRLSQGSHKLTIIPFAL